jgi:osmotically-inducible protein OsmY
MLTSTVVLFGRALSAYADNETSSVGVLMDTQITEAVEKAIAQHPDLKAPNQIYVDTRGHVVYLSGVVDNSLVTENAEQIARQVPGVVRVVNTIAVDQ